MTAQGGKTVAASMWSSGLMLTVHAENYSKPCAEYTRCTPCPLIPFNWVKLHCVFYLMDMCLTNDAVYQEGNMCLLHNMKSVARSLVCTFAGVALVLVCHEYPSH